MHPDRVNAALIGVWVLVVGTLGVGLGLTTFAGWTALVVVSLVPPAIVLRLCSA